MDVSETPADAVVDRLGALRAVVIEGDDQDATIMSLLRRVRDESLLIGMRRADVEARLGAGTGCGSDGGFASMGMASADLCFAVGRLPDGWNGGVPILLIAFDAADRVSRVMITHGQ